MTVKSITKVASFLFIFAFTATALFAEGGSAQIDSGFKIAKAIAVGITCSFVAIGVAWIGSTAAGAVGRNPGAAGEVLKIGIIGMAFVEAIAFYVLFLLN